MLATYILNWLLAVISVNWFIHCVSFDQEIDSLFLFLEVGFGCHAFQFLIIVINFA